jgi:2-aminobenzoate-CoA ligase
MQPVFQSDLPPAEFWPDRVYTLPELRYPPRLNVAREILDRNVAAGRGPRPAIHFGDQVITYADLQAQVNRLAGGLRAMGLARDDRVLIRLPNCPEFIISWLALQKLGAVAVSTMPMLRARELATIAGDAETRWAIVHTTLTEELEKARKQVAAVQLVIVVGGAGDATWEEIGRGQADSFEAADTLADDVAMIAYTSGSTGVPKGCVHMHQDILASADSYARYILRPTEEDVFGGHPTLAFTFGTGGLMVFPFRFGASTVLMPPFQPELMLETIQRYRISVVFCAPTSYRLMLQIPEMEVKHRLRSLRAGVSAAEALPAATCEEWVKRTGVELLDGIGSTEMFHIFLSSAPGRVRPGATGVPVPGYDCRVVDEQGKELGRGREGLLAVKGPTGCKYWRKPQRQAEYIKAGWNYPGDIYVQDEDGFFWYQCRSDDMIVSGGYKIPGPEVEHVLDAHPAVAESAVVASPDPTRGFVTKAFVVLKPGVTPTPALVEEIQEFVKGEIAPYKYPRLVEFVDRLPRTETGKIRRVELRQRETDRAGKG